MLNGIVRLGPAAILMLTYPVLSSMAATLPGSPQPSVKTGPEVQGKQPGPEVKRKASPGELGSSGLYALGIVTAFHTAEMMVRPGGRQRLAVVFSVREELVTKLQSRIRLGAPVSVEVLDRNRTTKLGAGIVLAVDIPMNL